MMRRGSAGISVFFLLALLFSACKKDKKDTIPPSIDVLLPAPNAHYQMFDTIVVTASLSDDVNLQRLEIVLRDQNENAVQQGVTFDLSGTGRTLNALIDLYEFRIPTGNYTLEFVLTDGVNPAVKRVPVHITESPYTKKGYYFVAKTPLQHTYYRTDTNFAQTSAILHTGTFEGSAISAYYQQLYTASGINQNFRTYNINTGTVKWTLGNPATGANMTCCTSDGKNVYLGKNDGNVYKYNPDGTIIRGYNSGELTYFVKRVFHCNDFVVAQLEEFSNGVRKTLVFDNATGVIRKMILNTNVKAAFQKSSSELYLFSTNTSGHAVIEILTLPGGNITQRYDFGAYEAYDACQVDSNTLFLSTSQGMIWQFQNSTTNVIQVLGTLSAKQMKYSDRFHELYIASDKEFHVYNVAPFSLTPKSYTLRNDTIADFQVIYNK